MSNEALKSNKYFQGRGAQVNPTNCFFKSSYVKKFLELIDDDMLKEEHTQ